MRYAACVEYDGTHFSGWQAQKDKVRTVQEQVELALGRVANHLTPIVTAGRTDRAVHATHQIIHFDSDAQRTDFAWCRGTNRFLDRDVRLKWVMPIDNEFHARFSALSRSYRFVIYNAPIKSALFRHHVTHEPIPLCFSEMEQAAKCLLGEHDFSSFRAAGCQANTPVRTVQKLELNRSGDWVWFDIRANAFLQHMVRNIAGCLIEVGTGKRNDDWLPGVLAAKDRTKAGITAPPNGLYLTGVEYPAEFSLPTSHQNVSFWGE
jgi:tRNA pseudouridine38-40 synthase